MLTAFFNCFKIPELRQRIIFTLAVIVFVRLGAAIPCPGVNPEVLNEFFRRAAESSQGNLLGLFNLFSGGALANCAIFSLTIMPYISASIVMQLATGVIPSIAKMAREEGGRQKITQYTRVATLILCLVQGWLLAVSWENPQSIAIFHGIGEVIEDIGHPLVENPGLPFRLMTVVTLTAGTMLLMWLGEQITDKGIGNGVSLIIAIGIVAQLPVGLVQAWSVFVPSGDTAEPISPLVLVLLVAFLFGVIAATVTITQGMRKVSVQYAKQMRGNKMYGGQTSYLPLKVNYSGVMPIIFATAVMMFPATLLTMVFPSSQFAARLNVMLGPGSWVYYFLCGVMIFLFSYFWVAIVFNPTQIADDMKRHGGFIPGVRPGEPTARFLDYSMTRLTFAGGIFLVVLFVLPMVVNQFLGVPPTTSQFFGGTGLLIIVGVMLDTMRQTETYLLQRHYDGFLKKGRIRGRSAAPAQAGASVSETKIVWLLAVVALIVVCGIAASLINS